MNIEHITLEPRTYLVKRQTINIRDIMNRDIVADRLWLGATLRSGKPPSN